MCDIRPAVERGNVLRKLCDPCLALWKADGEPREARPAPAHHFLTIISHGPLVIVRLPLLPGNKTPTPWRGVLKALTGVMASYGLKQKDISSIEGLFPFPDAVDAARTVYHQERINLEDAFAGNRERYKRFDLWDWQDGAFKPVRLVTDIGHT